eukprot:gene2401-1504_t
MGWKKEMHKKRKGKEKQLFRGIFAFIANRDLFAQSDFYFFHDSLRSAMPAPENCTETGKGKRNSCFAAFSPSLRIGICLPNQISIFSTIRYACHAGARKLYRLRRSFDGGFRRRAPAPEACDAAPSMSTHANRHQLFFDGARGKRGNCSSGGGEEKICVEAIEPTRKEKQLFRGIFAFIANRDLFAQSDFYFSTIRYARHAGARKLYRLRRSFDGGFHAGARPPQKPATQPQTGGKEKQLFRGIFAFIANRDLFAQSDFYFSTICYASHAGARKIVQVEKNFDGGFMPARARPRSLRRSPVDKQLFRGIFAFIANRDLFAQSDFYFSTIRYARHAGARKIVQVEKNLRRSPVDVDDANRHQLFFDGARGKRELLQRRKEKQLFRGIFAFIANRDLFAQSDFYFSTIVEKNFDDVVSRRRAPAPEACDAAPSMRRTTGIIILTALRKTRELLQRRKGEENICVEAIEPTRNSCFAAFSPSLRIGICLPNQISIFSTIRYARHAGARKIVQVEKNFWMMGFMPARARPRSLRRSPVDVDACQPAPILTALGENAELLQRRKGEEKYTWKPLSPRAMGGKRRCIRNGKGKEKQLFRGIFAFIANRDLFAQSDFYFFHDSTLMMGFMPARARPRSLRRSPVDVDACQPAPFFLTALGENAGIAPAAGRVKKNICVEAIEPTSHGWKKEMHKKRKGKEKQLFRGIFAFIANRDLLRRTFDDGFHAGAPAPEACDAAPSMSTHANRHHYFLTALGENAGIAPAAEGKEKQLFRGIFAFIANRDLFAQSDFYFSTIRTPAMPAPEKLYRLRRTLDDGFMPRAPAPEACDAAPSINGKGKEKQLFRGIFAFIANRDLFAQSDFYFFHDLTPAMPAPENCTETGKEKQLFRGIFAFIANRDLVKKNICVEAIEPTRFPQYPRRTLPPRLEGNRQQQTKESLKSHGWKKEMHKKRKGKEKQLFRGIFAFIANRFVCPIRFLFFHDSPPAMPAPEKLYRLRRSFGGSPAAPAPEACDAAPSINGKEKQLFRGIFAFIANRDLFAQSDFYFFHDSLRSAMPAPEKLYRLRRTFG